jgi:hypothetical protein
MSAMWWYTTNLATRKEKKQKRMQRLEEIMYRNQQGSDEIEQSPMCPICLEDFPDSEEPVDCQGQKRRKSICFMSAKVLLCGHKYHDSCIGEWLQRYDSKITK